MILVLAAAFSVAVVVLFCAGPGQEWLWARQSRREAQKILGIVDEMESVRPGDPKLAQVRVMAHMSARQWEEASKAARKLTARAPNDPEAWQLAIAADVLMAEQSEDPSRVTAAGKRLNRAADHLLALARKQLESGSSETIDGMFASIAGAYWVSGEEAKLRETCIEAAAAAERLRESPDLAKIAVAERLQQMVDGFAEERAEAGAEGAARDEVPTDG